MNSINKCSDFTKSCNNVWRDFDSVTRKYFDQKTYLHIKKIWDVVHNQITSQTCIQIEENLPTSYDKH